MKRHENLQPLSRQHHNGLLAVLLLEKGIKRGADARQLCDFINWIFTEDLDLHFRLEEQHLVPLMQQHPELAEMAARLLDEHRLLQELKGQINAALNPSDAAAFADLLEKHIRFEERVAFPAAEKYLTPEEMNGLGSALSVHDDQNCMRYPIKFWE